MMALRFSASRSRTRCFAATRRIEPRRLAVEVRDDSTLLLDRWDSHANLGESIDSQVRDVRRLSAKELKHAGSQPACELRLRELWVEAFPNAEANQGVLEAELIGLAAIDRGSPDQLSALAFIQQNVARRHRKQRPLLGLEVHLEDVRVVDEAVKHVGYAQVGRHVVALLVLRGTLASHQDGSSQSNFHDAPMRWDLAEPRRSRVPVPHAVTSRSSRRISSSAAFSSASISSSGRGGVYL